MKEQEIGDITICGMLDADDELNIEVACADAWINRDEAIRLIKHISEVFGI